MSMTAPSPRRRNDENLIPAHHRDALAPIITAPSPSPRPRQPLASFDAPNLFNARYPNTPGHAPRHSASGASPNDATPLRPLATKVDPDARELPLPKGLVFAPPPPPAASLLPLPTPPPHSRASRTLPSPHHGHSQHHSHGHGHALPPHQTPRHLSMGHSPLPHHLQSTPSVRSFSFSMSSPSTMSHMPSTPDMHASPYPPGPIDLHELLPPARFPGPLPQAYLNQGEMPGSTDGNDDAAVNDAASTSTRRTLVSCNPWDYRPEDHGKNKPRRRFSPGELDMLEILWGISHNPHKWQRQKLARWFGCTTRHLTVWFQNRRQDLKKAETLVQMAESNPDTASRAFAAVQRANRGDQAKYTPEQSQVIMDIVSDRLLPEMWFAQQPSGSSPTPGHKGTPSPPGGRMMQPSERRLAPYTPGHHPIAPRPNQGSHHPAGQAFVLKPVRRGYSLDDVCADRELSMTHRPSTRPRPRVDGFEQLHKNDPRYREALVNMLPSEFSSDAIEPPEDDDESVADEDSPTRKRARYPDHGLRAPRPTLPSIGLGRPPLSAGPSHRPRSSFGRASSSDVLACSSRARFLATNGLSSTSSSSLPSRAVTDPVGSRSVSAGPAPPPAPEHRNVHMQNPHPRSSSMSISSISGAEYQRKRKLSRQGSWSHLPTLKHRDSFDRSHSLETPIEVEEHSSPVPEQTRSPTPISESNSPKTAAGSDDIMKGPLSATSTTSSGGGLKQRLPLPEGRSIYSFSTVLEPETKRGNPEMDENVLTGAHALMELLRGR